MDASPVKPNDPLQFCLDIGTNSIGWAVFTLDRPGGAVTGFANGFGALPAGARVFPQGRDESKLTTLNATRRGQRLTARRLQRRSRQIKALAVFLRQEQIGLLPPPDSAEYRELLNNRGNLLNPYRLRAEAVGRDLLKHELGRVLLHLAKRRGYDAGRRFGSNRGDEDSKKLGPRIKALNAALGGMTLGQYLWHHGWCSGRPQRVRFHKGSEFYPTRKMLRDEFNCIRTRQQGVHTLDKDAWKRIEQLIFFRRRLKPSVAGDCPFTNEKRAAKALPVVQRYMLYKTLNDLRPRLAPNEIASIGAWAETRATIELKEIRQRLGWSDRLFSIERDRPGAKGRKTIRGDETSAALAQALGATWHTADDSLRDEIVRAALRPVEDDAARALAGFGLTGAQVDAVLEGLPEDYHAYGETVIRCVLPYLMRGIDERHALEQAGFAEQAVPSRERLPFYGEILRGQCQPIGRKTPNVALAEAAWGRIPNPTVHIALNQLRRLINAMLDVWGVPDRIVVETTRKLKLGAEALREERGRNRENEERNVKYDQEAVDILGHPLSPNQRERWRLLLALWHRQDKWCLYSGRPISCAALAADEVEIDHVLPWSRTLDDSRQNLVLVFRTANRRKARHTPWDAFDAETLDAIRERAAALHAKKQIPKDLLRRLDPVEGRKILESRNWLGRQLNDTAYTARVARTYLSCIVPKQRILFPSGAATAHARHALDMVKDRNDHRHHAMDAIAMGLIDWKTIHALNTASAQERELPAITPPDGMKRATEELLARIVVSHKLDHGRPRSLYGLDGAGGGASPTGELHEMFAYRVLQVDGKIATITRADDGKPNSGKKKPTASLRHIRHVRADGQELTRTVFTGGNAYLEVFELPPAISGRRTVRRTGGELVTEFDANSVELLPDGRKRPFQPRWVRAHKGARLLKRLHKGDMVEIVDGNPTNRYRIVKQMTEDQGKSLVKLTPHWCGIGVEDAKKDRSGLVRSMQATAVTANGVRLVSVDMLGRVNYRQRPG
jgi:CRISPR-associated endonuclease Csn1